MTERIHQIIRYATVNLSYEAQGKMQLVVILPPCSHDPAHQREQGRTDFLRRARGDEKAMHISRS